MRFDLHAAKFKVLFYHWVASTSGKGIHDDIVYQSSTSHLQHSLKHLACNPKRLCACIPAFIVQSLLSRTCNASSPTYHTTGSKPDTYRNGQTVYHFQQCYRIWCVTQAVVPKKDVRNTFSRWDNTLSLLISTSCKWGLGKGVLWQGLRQNICIFEVYEYVC